MSLSKPKSIEKIDIVYHPRFQKLGCNIDKDCEELEFENMKELEAHCHENHSAGSSLRDILNHNCGLITRKGVCRLSFKDGMDLFTHQGIRHFDTASFYCNQCHFGK